MTKTKAELQKIVAELEAERDKTRAELTAELLSLRGKLEEQSVAFRRQQSPSQQQEREYKRTREIIELGKNAICQQLVVRHDAGVRPPQKEYDDDADNEQGKVTEDVRFLRYLYERLCGADVPF